MVGIVRSTMPFLHRLSVFALVGVFAVSFAQSPSKLSLTDALSLAKERNGLIRSAYWTTNSYESALQISRAAYYPVVTPGYTYNTSRQQVSAGLHDQFLQSEGGTTLVSASWKLLDTGERDLSVRSSSRSLQAQRFSGRQTLRATLFSVVQQYYDTLRAQELQRVAVSQVNELTEVLKSVEERIKNQDAAEIERLQAVADLQNARVSVLTAKNRVFNASATLKGTLGLDASQTLPELTKDETPPSAPVAEDLTRVVEEGLKARPDLESQRWSTEAQRFASRLAMRQAGPTFSVDLTYRQQVTPTSLEDRALLFSVSVPFLDGGSHREAALQQKYLLKASEATLLQAERTARAEIESAYEEHQANSERFVAASAALEAARANYRAAAESQALGAYNLLQVLTAEVSRVTAESNYIQAVYDYRISEIKLSLVTGRAVPGE